jgi:hypothetical protein
MHGEEEERGLEQAAAAADGEGRGRTANEYGMAERAMDKEEKGGRQLGRSGRWPGKRRVGINHRRRLTLMSVAVG